MASKVPMHRMIILFLAASSLSSASHSMIQSGQTISLSNLHPSHASRPHLAACSYGACDSYDATSSDSRYSSEAQWSIVKSASTTCGAAYPACGCIAYGDIVTLRNMHSSHSHKPYLQLCGDARNSACGYDANTGLGYDLGSCPTPLRIQWEIVGGSGCIYDGDTIQLGNRQKGSYLSLCGHGKCGGYDAGSSSDLSSASTKFRIEIRSPGGCKELAMWRVASGSCTIDSSGCLLTPYHPQHYRNNEYCSIDVDSQHSVAIEGPFNTEHYYDKLEIDGKQYHGAGLPSPVVPTRSIVWSSDYSVTATGFKLCPVASLWVVKSGPCTIDVQNCLLSPNYPSRYENDQKCLIDVAAINSGTISFEHFSTEAGYDKLTFTAQGQNSPKEFSGGSKGVHSGEFVPVGTITWSSDYSIVSTGFRICLGDSKSSSRTLSTVQEVNDTNIEGDTVLTASAKPGSTVLYVEGLHGFKVHDPLHIDAGYSHAEACEIEAFGNGSIIVKKPLKNDHKSGSVVQVIKKTMVVPPRGMPLANGTNISAESNSTASKPGNDNVTNIIIFACVGSVGLLGLLLSGRLAWIRNNREKKSDANESNAQKSVCAAKETTKVTASEQICNSSGSNAVEVNCAAKEIDKETETENSFA